MKLDVLWREDLYILKRKCQPKSAECVSCSPASSHLSLSFNVSSMYSFTPYLLPFIQSFSGSSTLRLSFFPFSIIPFFIFPLYFFRSVILPSLIPSFHCASHPTFLLSIHYFVLPHFICHYIWLNQLSSTTKPNIVYEDTTGMTNHMIIYLPRFSFLSPLLFYSFRPSFVASFLRYFPLISNSIPFLPPFYMEIGDAQTWYIPNQVGRHPFIDTAERVRCSRRIIVRIAEAVTFIYTSDWACFSSSNVYWHQ